MNHQKEPTLQDKVGCALFVMAAESPDAIGVWTKNRLMWPYQTYTDDDVRRQAAKLMASVCTALLEAVPQPRRQQIWTDQAAYLSFALDGEPQGESCWSEEARLHRLVELPPG